MINHRTVPHTHIRCKSFEEIKAQCEVLGLTLKSKLYTDDHADHVMVEGGGARVYYNTTNGVFFGTTDLGVEFASDSDAHDHEPWFQTLLDFFLVGRIEVKPS